MALSALLTRLITHFITVDNSYIEYVVEKYPVSSADALPEPWEMTGFVFFWILYALSFIIIYGWLEKKNVRIARGTAPLVSVILTILGTYILFHAEEDMFYINMSWFMKWYGIVISIVLFAILTYISIKKDIAILVDCISIGLIVVSSAFCFVRNPLFGTNAFHFNGFFTTIYNVYNGATLGVDSKIIYGTYGYLFFPLYKILGLSLRSYAMITACMCLTVLSCEYCVIRNLIENPILRLMSVMVCIYINVFFAVNAHYEQFITQHFPMRVFFPMIMVAWITMTAKKGILSDGRETVIGIMICYLAFMMNLESAVTTSLTWASGMFFYQMSRRETGEKPWQMINSLVKLLLGIVVAFAGWILTIEAITVYRTGNWLAISEFYSTQVVFSKAGYGMLPLPDYLHIYIFVFLLYALFLGVGIQRIFFDRNGYYYKDQISFALSVSGILMLIYYMGRTHNRSLFTWLCPSAILLTYILDTIVKNHIVLIGNKFKITCIGITGVIIFSILSVYALSSIYVLKESELYQDFIDRQIQDNYDDTINSEIDFLNKYAENGSVNYIGNYSAGILLAAGLKNNFLGEMALCWYSWDDYKYIERFIESCEGIIIIEGNAYNQIETYIPNEFEQIMISKGYRIIDESSLSKAWGK